MRSIQISLLLFFLVTTPSLFNQSAAGQSAAEPTVHRRTAGAGRLLFPCYAKVIHPPKTFRAPWKPRAVNEPENERVTVIVGFDDPDPEFPFDCVGEPLQVTVPNGQIVNLVKENWAPGVCTPTITLNPVVPESAVAELLTLIARVGSLGVDGGSSYYELPALKNKVLNVTVACIIPKSDRIPQRKLTQAVTITYQNPPRIAVSAGLLASTEGVKSYTILTTKTGVSSSGVDTSQTSIGVSGNSSAQVIPFGFVNVYLWGSRKANLSTQFGVGVNPNLSTPRIEFFAAPIAVAWHDFYFAPGIHIGQHEKLTGGFAVGDLVTGLSKPPIGWQYRAGLGFSLSYNLKPLIKSAAPSSSK